MSFIDDLIKAGVKRKMKKEWGAALSHTCGMSDDEIDDFFEDSFAESKRNARAEQARAKRAAEEELRNRRCCANCNYFMNLGCRTDLVRAKCREHDIEFTYDEVEGDYIYTHGCNQFLRR